MAGKTSEMNVVRTEIINDMAGLLSVYLMGTQETMDKAESHFQYLLDDENLDGSAFEQLKEDLRDTKKYMDLVASKFKDMETITKGILNIYEGIAGRSSKTFEEAQQATKASMLKLQEAGKK